MRVRVGNKLGPWVVCSFLFFATALNYMDRQTLAIAAPLIQKELTLDNAQLGLLLSAFFYTYGIMQVVVGPLLDRVDVRWGYAIAVWWWSLAGILTGFAHGFGQLFACRLMLGMGEAANWPAALRITSRIFPPEKRALANGFFNSGASVGAVLTPPLMVWLSVRWDWRLGFIVTGVLGIVWTSGWLVLTGKQQTEVFSREVTVDHQALVSSIGSSEWGAILCSPRFWGLVLASAFANPCYYFYANWLPTYFVQERGISFGLELGGTMMVPYLGLAIGGVVGGIPVLWLTRRGLSVGVSRKWVIGTSTLLMVAAISVPWVTNTVMALLLLFLITVSMGSWLANYLAFVQDVSEKHVAGVAGVIGSFGAFSGAFLIWVAGWLSKVAESFAPIFLALGIMPIIAAFGILVIMSAPRPQASPVTAS